MRSKSLFTVAAAGLLLGACGSDEPAADVASTNVSVGTDLDSQSLTEEEGETADRGFASTDLRLELGAIADGDSVVVTGSVTNAGPSESSNVRVRIDGGDELAPPDSLGPNCEIVESAIECVVSASLAVTGSAPDRPADEIAEFEVILQVDAETLTAGGTLGVMAVVTADDLDLGNDTDPDNNSAALAVEIPAR